MSSSSGSDDLTKEDFFSVGWPEVIAGCEDKECAYFSSRLATRARDAEEAGDTKAGQVLALLSSLTSMYLKLDSPEEPFGPMMVFHDRRTAIADDFDEKQLDLLADVVAEVGDPELRARIADVLWLRRRDHRMAELAVSSYIESAKRLEDPERWVGTVDRLQRAMQIAAMLGRNSSPFKAVTEHIEGVLDAYKGEDPLFMSARLMSILLDRRVGDHTRYAALAEKLASRAEDAGDWHRARECWSVKARWHFLGKDQEGARQAKLAEAETYVKEAEAHLSGSPPSYMMASAFLQQAIEAFRRAGGAGERIEELHRTLLEYQQRSVSELIPYSADVDITDIVRAAIDHVKGKALFDALMSLAMIGNPPKVDHLRAQAEDNKKRFVLQNIIPRTYLNAMGRVIARQPGNEEEYLLADMYSNASNHRALHVQGLVEPARQQVNSEHHVRVQDFLSLVSNHPFVPRGRELIVALGLNAGMQGDFLTAVHFLIPQLEESVRYILFQLGVITSGIDDDGIQDEYNLNRMLSATKYSAPLAKFLGEDFVFDM
ncbi:MAG: DUF4209 domain-containing protein, partial [Acidobacteriota bacterium]|nr:DUF4209 domain-containing protein [Acidobacteriota bacterium]